jgi:hypothetical protein
MHLIREPSSYINLDGEHPKSRLIFSAHRVTEKGSAKFFGTWELNFDDPVIYGKMWNQIKALQKNNDLICIK